MNRKRSDRKNTDKTVVCEDSFMRHDPVLERNRKQKPKSQPNKTLMCEDSFMGHDPVLEKNRKESKQKPKSQPKPEKKTGSVVTIKPALSTRLDYHTPHCPDTKTKIEDIPKFLLPKTKKQKKEENERRQNYEEDLNFCRYSVLKLPSPSDLKTIEVKAPSADIKEAKVWPRKPSITSSALYPDPPKKCELKLKKPKSGIFINETKKKKGGGGDGTFRRKSRTKEEPSKRRRPSKVSTKGRKSEPSCGSVALSEYSTTTGQFATTMDVLAAELATIEEFAEEEDVVVETFLTKQFRKAVEQLSKTTSMETNNWKGDESIDEERVSRIIQKFRRDSEEECHQTPKRKIKRGTLENHSFTKLKQPTLKTFYFGVKLGTVYQADEHFSGSSRNRQGICVPIAAFCLSMVKHPDRWTREDIDEVLEAGTRLFEESSGMRHIHEEPRQLTVDELKKYCTIGGRKIRFQISEPEVSGYVRSDDKKIYNLTKALNIFFGRHKAGILQTDTVSIALWKDRHFYFFDGCPRTIDLYTTEQGVALMAHFYDVTSIVTVLLTRSGIDNPPFVIYAVTALRIVDKEAEEVDSKDAIEEKENYQVLSQEKAVVLGSFDLADKCFGFTRSKQALAIALVALVYSKITPASAWHKGTVDKILIIGNQLFLECAQCEDIEDLTLDDLPAVFTIGPYVTEIYIYASRFVDLLFRKGECTLTCCLERFFETNTNAIVQIDKFTIAIWKQRTTYHCFDPYSRSCEGLRTRDGAACASMHSTIGSLVETVAANFDNKGFIFHVHAMKICKIHRDPDQSRNLTMKDCDFEQLKSVKMRKGGRSATTKNVTVDFSNKSVLYGESPEESIQEVGSDVASLLPEQLPPMVHKFPSRSIMKMIPADEDFIADLDSPSLSDTQIEPVEVEDEEAPFIDLDAFGLTQEELELSAQMEEESGSVQENLEQIEEEELEASKEAEGESDWFMTTYGVAQVDSGSLERSRISEEINTDLAYFTVQKEELPSLTRRDFVTKKKQKKMTPDEEWQLEITPEPDVTQSQELGKDTNFVDLPDDTQIVLGSQNMSQFGSDLEFMAPFICIMAAVVAKKYSITTWSRDIVDYVLQCGAELFRSSGTRYDQVSKLEIPRVSLGRSDYSIRVNYIFDTYTKQKILEMAIEKILFTKSNCGVLVTPTYACTLFAKNHLYYLYDGFGNNEVGLGSGVVNTGVACLARFKNVHSLATRIIHNKKARESEESVEYNRFVLSCCFVEQIPREDGEAPGAKEEEEEENLVNEGEGFDDQNNDGEVVAKEYRKRKELDDDKEPRNKVGYQNVDGDWKIEGTSALDGGSAVSETLKADYFVCLCACLMLLNCPIQKWDTRKMDQVVDQGQHVFSHADELGPSSKKIIKNILIEDYFFNIIANRIKLTNFKTNRNLRIGIETLILKKHEYFLVQFPNRSYVVYLFDNAFHLFDPCDKSGRASWTRFANTKKLVTRINRGMVRGGESYNFHGFEITSITKAPKTVIVANRLQRYRPRSDPKPETTGKPFHEETRWLDVEPIPWSRKRNKDVAKWHDWNVEIDEDLFSLFGNLHQNSERFPESSRGKQTLANLVVGIAMTEIYDLAEWTPVIIDAILVNGDNYFRESVEDVRDENHEISVDDLKKDCSVFPYSFGVKFTPIVEGTMFLVRLKQFNLYKALRYFFDDFERRYGLVVVIKGDKKRQVAFGKIQESEYFMFDCEFAGPPMFLENQGTAYILRARTLNRLLHVLTLTLRGGDFYVFEVGTSEFKPMI